MAKPAAIVMEWQDPESPSMTFGGDSIEDGEKRGRTP